MPIIQPASEVLAPSLSRGHARDLERQAKRHYRATERNLMQFCADLRRLQDGGAHFVRGFDSFGAYVEHTFEGLSATSAKQLSRQGQALLVLETGERISLAGSGENLPGTTGLRALASVLNQHGEQIMLSVHDRAAALRPGRKIVGETVTTAMRGLIAVPGPKALDPPPTGQADEPSFAEASEDEEDDQPEEAHELFDRAYRLREILNDFSLAVGAHKFKDARRALEELAQERIQLVDALDALEQISA